MNDKPLDHSAVEEFTLRQADDMRVEASRQEQMGFKETARFLRKNADAALRWAGSSAARPVTADTAVPSRLPDRCDCVLSIKGGSTCWRCRQLVWTI